MDSLGYHHLMWDDAAQLLPGTAGAAAPLLPGTAGVLFCPCDSFGGGCCCLRNGISASSFLSDAAAHDQPAPSAEQRGGEIRGARGGAALVEESKLDSDDACSAAATDPDHHPKEKVQEKVCKKPRKRSEQKDEKRSKPKLELQPPPAGVVHVRARRGQATYKHSLAERVRREKLSERMKILQGLVPDCDEIKGKQRVLEEIIKYVRSLQNEIEFLSMKLVCMSPLLHDLGINLDELSMNIQPDNQNMITDENEMMLPQPLPSLCEVSAFFQSSSSIDHRIRNCTYQTMEVEEKDSEALLSYVPGQGHCPLSQGAGASSVMQQFSMLDQKLGFPLDHLNSSTAGALLISKELTEKPQI